jgi:hypothetical protein
MRSTIATHGLEAEVLARVLRVIAALKMDAD